MQRFLTVWRGAWVWLAALALAGAASCLLTRYVGQERTFYFWDHALYPGFASSLWAVLQQSGWGAVLRAIQVSLNDDFSRFFTLPALLGFMLTGADARLTYIQANFIAYGLGLALLLAGILRQLRGGSYGVNLVAALLGLLGCGFAWVSVVEGYPDMGGTVFLAGAVLLLFAHWPQVSGWRWLAAGVLLAGAILLRRHFIYPAAVLLAVTGAVQLFWFWRYRLARAPGAYPPVLGPALAALSLMVVLYGLAPGFVMRLLTMNYPELYASYAEPVDRLLDKDLSRVGALGLLAALAGYALAWRQEAQRARLAVLLGVLSGWGCLWFGWVRFGGQHYLLQIMPIILPLGWVLLWNGLRQGGQQGRAAAYGVGGLLGVQALLTFWLADGSAPQRMPTVTADRQWFTGLLAETRAPRMRSDYDTLTGLVGYLSRSLRADDKVAVLASSPIFNQDIFMAAVMARRKNLGSDDFIPLVSMPDIDRRDPLPLDAMSQATILLLATPPQFHLAAEGQTVMGSAIALLTEDAEFQAAWQRDMAVYQLEQGVTLSLWRLQRPWTPAERSTFLARLRQRAAASGSPPQDWVAVQAAAGYRSLTDAQNRTRMIGTARPGMPPTIVLFTPPLLGGRYQLSGMMLGTPCLPDILLTSLSGSGALLGQERVIPDAAGQFATVVAFTPSAPAFVQLVLQQPEQGAGAACAYEIRDLTVQRQD